MAKIQIKLYYCLWLCVLALAAVTSELQALATAAGAGFKEVVEDQAKNEPAETRRTRLDRVSKSLWKHSQQKCQIHNIMSQPELRT